MNNESTILAMVDIAHRDNALRICRKAVSQCQQNDSLHVAYVMPYGYFSYIEPFVPEENIKAAAKRAHDELDSIIAEVNIDSANAHILRGGVAEQALLLAKEIDASLIVLNAHRPDVKMHSLGSYATQIVGNAECSVLIVR